MFGQYAGFQRESPVAIRRLLRAVRLERNAQSATAGRRGRLAIMRTMDLGPRLYGSDTLPRAPSRLAGLVRTGFVCLPHLRPGRDPLVLPCGVGAGRLAGRRATAYGTGRGGPRCRANLAGDAILECAGQEPNREQETRRGDLGRIGDRVDRDSLPSPCRTESRCQPCCRRGTPEACLFPLPAG